MNRRDFNRLAVTSLAAAPVWLRPRIRPVASRVMILSGQNNHDWVRTNPMIVDILEENGLFTPTIVNAPAGDAGEDDWNAWRPDFSAYDVILSNYNGEMWPEAVRADFERYIDGGGQALMLHAANNAFEGWTEFEQMVGLLWRDSDYGERVYLEDDGTPVRVPAGDGPDAGHGQRYDWTITTRDAAHPIMDGVPAEWLHAYDELYHGQRGPAQNMHILASAYSVPDQGGTGEHEPMIWWIPYGEGRVLTFLPGHLWGDQDNTEAFRCVGLRTVLQRSLEWLATDDVTLPIPDSFPTLDQKSVIPA